MSEFRQDLVSGDWIIIAAGRAKRPHDLSANAPKRVVTPKDTCPFEDLQKSGNWPPVAIWPDEKNWRAVLIPNKYPALEYHDTCAIFSKQGPYDTMTGVGRNELIVPHDHATRVADLPQNELLEIFKMLQHHYKTLADDDCFIYTSTFFNWGPTAGASLYHPHFQVATFPAIPPHIEHSLQGSERYFKTNGTCAHCVLIEYESNEKKRIVAENENAIALAPFASRQPFEVRIFPKKHHASFEGTSENELKDIVGILQEVLKAMELRLNDPDLNFFIHTAPLKELPQHEHYHWHMELLPKLAIGAGFEIGTGVDINVVDPDDAAKILRGESQS